MSALVCEHTASKLSFCLRIARSKGMDAPSDWNLEPEREKGEAQREAAAMEVQLPNGLLPPMPEEEEGLQGHDSSTGVEWAE